MRLFALSILMASAVWALVCAPTDEFAEQIEQPEITHAIAVLHPTEGNDVRGIVYFERAETGIRIRADIEGLSRGKHGFHIHEYGDCSAEDATSAGGHYNPTDSQHGAPDDVERHVGDLGNVVADGNGVVDMEWIDATIQLNGEHSIIGRSVVVHANEDDFTTQPTGAAGPRLACGVVGVDE